MKFIIELKNKNAKKRVLVEAEKKSYFSYDEKILNCTIIPSLGIGLNKYNYGEEFFDYDNPIDDFDIFENEVDFEDEEAIENLITEILNEEYHKEIFGN